MQKIFLYFLIYFLIAGPCCAAPCYGTRMPDKEKFFSGIQNYTVLNRYLKDHNGKMRSVQNFILISYGLFDWLSIDLKGAAGNVRQHPEGEDEIDYSTYLGGGYGFRIKILEENNTKMVFGFQHISIHPHTTHIAGKKNKAVLDDWQFSFLASRQFSLFTPYLGTRWSRMDYIHWVNNERSRKKSDLTKNIGLIVGVDIPLGERVWFNIEGNFFDVEAFATSLNFQF